MSVLPRITELDNVITLPRNPKGDMKALHQHKHDQNQKQNNCLCSCTYMYAARGLIHKYMYTRVILYINMYI